jgi:hypothetical protein
MRWILEREKLSRVIFTKRARLGKRDHAAHGKSRHFRPNHGQGSFRQTCAGGTAR